MIHDTGVLNTRLAQLHQASWIPESSLKGVVVFNHGLGEHGDRYQEFASFLTAAGYGFFVYDMLGHGRSPGRRAYLRHFEDSVQTFSAQVLDVQKRYPDVPVVLMGQSLGAAVVYQYLLDFPDTNRAGAVLMSPLLKLPPDLAPILQKIAPILSVLIPWMKTEKLDSSHLSRDPTVVNAYDNDPLTYHQGIPARTGGELIRMISAFEKRFSEDCGYTLIVHGTADKITDPEGSRRFASAGFHDKRRLNLYDGFFHETIRDIGKETVIEDIISWLDERCAS